MNNLPVRSSRKKPAAIAAPYTRRAGLMVGLVMFAVMACSTWGLGWVAVVSALLPMLIGASAAGVAEKSRLWSKRMGNPLPLALGGALLGAVMGGMLAPFWALAAAIFKVTLPVSLPAAASGHLFLAGLSLGAATGATAGVAVGVTQGGKDPIQTGASAALFAGVTAFAGFYTGAFAAGIALLASWLGAETALFATALAYAPAMLGTLGISAVAATAAFAGTLTIKGAEAREKSLALPDPSDMPSWARSDSVSGFHRDNSTLHIG